MHDVSRGGSSRQHDALAAPDPDDRSRTVAERLARVMIERVETGDCRAMTEVFDRTEGKPKERVEVSGKFAAIQEFGVIELCLKTGIHANC